MLFFRFLLLAFALVGWPLLAQETTAPSQMPAEKLEPARPPEPRISFNWINVEGPYIAMTFDDGPSDKLTARLLDLLKAHRIKATFFVIGQNVVEHPELVQRAAREGHEIANHSWSHPNLGKMSDESVRRELQKTDDAIKDAIGVRPTLMRPPYGSFSERQKRWARNEFGYLTILWDVDPLDWKRPGPAAVCNRIVKETRAGSIVLAHDIHPGTIEAMPATFDQLEAKGFKFVTVTELIRMARPETPTPKPSPKASPSERPRVSTPVATPAPRSTSTPSPNG